MDYRFKDRATRRAKERPFTAQRLLRWLPGAFMLLFLALGGLMALLSPATFSPPEDESVMNGDWTAAYQADFEKKLALRTPAVNLWGVLEYTLFREGRPGVLIGEDGWLFTTEEFQTYPDGAAATEQNLETILSVRDRLAGEGVALVVAVLPAKASVYEEALGRYTLPAEARARYDNLRGNLLEHNIIAPDVLGALLGAKTTAPVFLRTDTHWTPFGARAVAELVAREVQAKVPFEGLGKTEFETQASGSESYRGDLLAFVPLGGLERLGPRADGLEQVKTTPLEAGSSLFGEPRVPVALVGSSYSANSRWNFGGALQNALRADVLNAAEEGQGPFAPMTQYLASEAFRNARPELVIWEIPARYLPVRDGAVGGATDDATDDTPLNAKGDS